LLFIATPQQDFSKAAQDLRNSQSTAQKSGYHGANLVVEENLWFRQETVNALANLATATASDHSIMANVTAALAVANAEIASLKKELSAIPTTPWGNATPPWGNNNPTNAQLFKHGNWCWSHGFCFTPAQPANGWQQNIRQQQQKKKKWVGVKPSHRKDRPWIL
jgi:hypothetical protein